jgi:hypothetical protein
MTNIIILQVLKIQFLLDFYHLSKVTFANKNKKDYHQPSVDGESPENKVFNYIYYEVLLIS